MDGLFNFAKSIAKMAIVGVVAFLLIRADINKLANLQTINLWLGITLIANITIKMFILTALLLLALSIPDLFFQRWRYKEDLKMSRAEVKEERKMYEGDPQVRNRIRQRMRELQNRNMIVNVPKADVVVTNPTHYAVALQYDRSIMPAPRVIAKGEDELAQRIKRIARDNEVPIVENKPLARALYAETEVGDIIPLSYYEVVATVLSKVMALNEKRRRSQGVSA
jgi:flagellar biosynthetic protein FlhB